MGSPRVNFRLPLRSGLGLPLRFPRLLFRFRLPMMMFRLPLKSGLVEVTVEVLVIFWRGSRDGRSPDDHI